MCDLLFIFAQDKTGSFNFTKSAQVRNAENVLVIHDQKLAKKYKQNWSARLRVSKNVKQYYQDKHEKY